MLFKLEKRFIQSKLLQGESTFLCTNAGPCSPCLHACTVTTQSMNERKKGRDNQREKKTMLKAAIIFSLGTIVLQQAAGWTSPSVPPQGEDPKDKVCG